MWFTIPRKRQRFLCCQGFFRSWRKVSRTSRHDANWKALRTRRRRAFSFLFAGDELEVLISIFGSCPWLVTVEAYFIFFCLNQIGVSYCSSTNLILRRLRAWGQFPICLCSSHGSSLPWFVHGNARQNERLGCFVKRSQWWRKGAVSMYVYI